MLALYGPSMTSSTCPPAKCILLQGNILSGTTTGNLMSTQIPVSKPAFENTAGFVTNQNELFWLPSTKVIQTSCIFPIPPHFITAYHISNTCWYPITIFAFSSALLGCTLLFDVCVLIVTCMSSGNFTMLQRIFLRNAHELQLCLFSLIRCLTWPFITHRTV